MGLRIIHGKPGSGKSCYCMYLLAKMISDWVRYENENGEPYSRKLYTNIPVDVEEMNHYLESETGVKCDVSHYVEVLDESFFRTPEGEYREWWLHFEQKAYVVIDEVHHYLPASIRKKKYGQDLADMFMNYVSMHRHRQHDLIFLTQHVDNVSVEIKKQAEVIYEVLNVKNSNIGLWPFVVPMADIDVVRESWGFPVQLAHIKRGVCEARSVKYDKNFEAFILSPSLFKLYRSHTMADEALDRPSLKLGRLGSLVWFARRHLMRMGFWTIMIICFVVSFRDFAINFPSRLVDSLIFSSLNLDTNKSAPLASPADSAASVSEPSEPGHTEHFHVVDPAAQPVDDIPTTADIQGFVKGGVITKKGILRQNDHILVNGETDFVQQVDVLRGVLYLGSGKKVQK